MIELPIQSQQREGLSDDPVPTELLPLTEQPPIDYAADDDGESGMVPRAPKSALAWGNIALVFIVFLFDAITPESYHVSYLYNICIALSILTWDPRWVFTLSGLTVLLRMIGYAIERSHSHLPPGIETFNVVVSVSVQVLTGFLIWSQVLSQRRFAINQRYARHHEAALLAAERRAREEAQRTQELTGRHAAELAAALADARRAMWQAQEAIQREREARRRETVAREREMKASGDLERIKNLSVALHNAVLPQIPREVSNGRIRLGSMYSPAERDILIGGDFYDVLQLDKNGDRIGLVIGDVAGHGVEAAAQTALVTTTLRAYAIDSGESPVNILTRTAKLIDTMLASFVSLFFGVYDTRTHILTYTNAGHEPPIVIYRDRPQYPEPLDPTGSILGVGMLDFEEATIRIDPGDVLAMFTDGLTEVRSSVDKLLGWDGVASIIAERAMNLDDAQLMADGIVSDVRWISHNQRLSDDVALLIAVFAEPNQPKTTAKT
ncbi:MAG: PP2C family protein-serine/threonine phosphatase [Capsulimonadaceae bacterium]